MFAPQTNIDLLSGRVTTENSLSKFLMGNQFNEVRTDQQLSCTFHVDHHN